ncbi:MAG: hypothetical protein ACLPYY_13990 [Acidimicrobiales bacterium]
MSDELERLRRYASALPEPGSELLGRAGAELDSAIGAEAATFPEPHGATASRRASGTGPGKRRAILVGLVVVLIATAVSVPFLASRTSHSTRPQPRTQRPSRLVVQLVADDLDVTVASGNYDMTYSDTTTPPTQCPQAGTGPSVVGQGCSPLALSAISGHGTVDTNPYAMVTVSDDGPLGTITLYDNGTNVWEIGGGDYGLAGPGQAGPGAPLSGYAGSVEGTVGQVAGALDMQGLASGTGYLDLETREIQGAQPAGTGTVDGVPVTVYKLSESGLQDPETSGLTPQQMSTIRAADAIIENSGFAGKTTWVSVDGEGYIREQKTEYTLPDGSTVTEDTILSNFGCAGTVLMPGQVGATAPPAGCVSPDTSGRGQSPAGTTLPSNGVPAVPTTAPPSSTVAPTTTPASPAAVSPEQPGPLALGPNGDLYIADDGLNEVLARLPGGGFQVVAGTGKAGYSGDGGPATRAQLTRPSGLAVAADGTLYIADTGNERVRAVLPDGTITTVAGNGQLPAQGLGGTPTMGLPATQTAIGPTYAVAVGANGTLYIAALNTVLSLSPSGGLSIVTDGTSFTGLPVPVPSADGCSPESLAVDGTGDLFIGCSQPYVLVERLPDGTLQELGSVRPHDAFAALAGVPSGGVLAVDGASVAQFGAAGQQTIVDYLSYRLPDGRPFWPQGIAEGGDGTLYLAQDGVSGIGPPAVVARSPSGTTSVLWSSKSPPS